METLKYTVIKTNEQYVKYCDKLENLICSETNILQEEIDLLTLLIEKWDKDNNSFKDVDPIKILKNLMTENNLKAKDLVVILGLSKGTVSKILNYQKGLSKETIRRLSSYFKISQETFNRPYRIENDINRHFKHSRLMNTRKNMKDLATV